MQTINVSLGGTLKQHIKGHPYSENRDDCVHKVYTPSEFVKKGKQRRHLQEVNSMHHQAIDTLAPNLSTLLYAADGQIEAVKHRTLPIFAVQYHPEEIWDRFAERIITFLLADEEEEGTQATTTEGQQTNK